MRCQPPPPPPPPSKLFTLFIYGLLSAPKTAQRGFRILLNKWLCKQCRRKYVLGVKLS